MGAAGVALAAASTHGGGGENGQTAAHFLVLHATALIAVAACARAYADRAAIARALVVAVRSSSPPISPGAPSPATACFRSPRRSAARS
jgi:hypothetical protein